MKRVIPTKPNLLREMKEKTGCANKETASSRTCTKAKIMYKGRGGKFKRIKTIKETFHENDYNPFVL